MRTGPFLPNGGALQNVWHRCFEAFVDRKIAHSSFQSLPFQNCAGWSCSIIPTHCGTSQNQRAARCLISVLFPFDRARWPTSNPAIANRRRSDPPLTPPNALAYKPAFPVFPPDPIRDQALCPQPYRRNSAKFGHRSCQNSTLILSQNARGMASEICGKGVLVAV
jgi:hypothetical protein